MARPGTVTAIDRIRSSISSPSLTENLSCRSVVQVLYQRHSRSPRRRGGASLWIMMVGFGKKLYGFVAGRVERERQRLAALTQPNRHHNSCFVMQRSSSLAYVSMVHQYGCCVCKVFHSSSDRCKSLFGTVANFRRMQRVHAELHVLLESCTQRRRTMSPTSKSVSRMQDGQGIDGTR